MPQRAKDGGMAIPQHDAELHIYMISKRSISVNKRPSLFSQDTFGRLFIVSIRSEIKSPRIARANQI